MVDNPRIAGRPEDVANAEFAATSNHSLRLC